MKLSENIYSVGVIDSEVRVFHGYQTPIGTSYNSYLVVDEKITLIDFVKAPFTNDLLDNIQKVIGHNKIDYVICNHVEPDHSGALPGVIEHYPDVLIYGTENCKKELEIYYPNTKMNFVSVKTNDVLNTGKYNFKFIPMPMIHWPDSMATYLVEEKILFSNDALGQHIGTGEVFDTQVGFDKLIERAADYYANIVLPFGPQVAKLIETLTHVEINTICPSHGVMLTEFIPQMLEKYTAWSQNITENKLVIVYDTMWGTTHKLALKLHDEYVDKGFDVEMINLSQEHYSYAMAKLLEAKYIFVGSPTLNNQMLPSVSAFLTYMCGLKPKNRIGKAFGSYGWSGESIKHIDEILTACGFEMTEPLKTLWNV